jgi:hypothetical protein
MLSALLPFLVLLVVAIIISYIPMDGTIRKVIYLIVGIIALLMVLQFAKLI